MAEGTAVIAAHALRLALALPPNLVKDLAQAISDCKVDDWDYARQQILQITPHPRFRTLIEELLTAWRVQASKVQAESVAMALLTAITASQHYREAQSVDLVWTGPGVMDAPLRRTDQALLEVIEAAQRSLWVVSFAVYKIPAITQALVKAFERGVDIRICLETPDSGGQRVAYDTIRALGPEVRQRATIYVWPQEQRLVGADGNAGSLHAKCAVADDQVLFVSSANLTDHAMNLNMEMGVLVQGGPLPARVAAHFMRLVGNGVLISLAEAR